MWESGSTTTLRDGLMLLIAFAGTVTLVPPVRRIARHTGMLDKPTARKLHLDPTPLLGGLPMYLAVVLVVFVFLEREAWNQAWAILAGGTLLLIVGLVDDVFSLPAGFKLGVAIPAAALLLVASGIRTMYPANLIAVDDSWISTVLVLAISMCWIVGITAAFAILDHMDGLCAGVAAIASAYFYGLAIAAGQLWVSALAAALVGVGLGFLVWNFKPAKIFMGDGGAMFLGFMVAALGIKLRMSSYPPTNTWMVPILVLAVPILDTSLVTISRLRRGLLPMRHPGKDHLAHRLLNLGLGQRGAVLSIYVVAIAAGALASTLLEMRAIHANIVVGCFFVLGVLAVLLLERAPYDRQESRVSVPSPLASRRGSGPWSNS